MLDDYHKVDLTRQDLELIEAALHTQEKILAVQTRAGGDNAQAKLDALKGLIRRLGRQAPPSQPTEGGYSISQVARSLFL